MMHTFIRKSRWEFWSKQIVYDISKSPKIKSKLRTLHTYEIRLQTGKPILIQPQTAPQQSENP